MTVRGKSISFLAATFLLAGWLGAGSASGSSPGFSNPSIRAMVDESKPMPKSGTIGWGAAVYRVELLPEVSLASVDERLRASLLSGFGKKGFVFKEEEPDYLISYALAVGAEIDEAELNKTYGDLLDMPAAATNEAESLYYKRGVLIVDLVDRKAKHLLWRGAIMAEIELKWPEARKQERCDEAIRQLMTFFPRPPKAIPEPAGKPSKTVK